MDDGSASLDSGSLITKVIESVSGWQDGTSYTAGECAAGSDRG